MCAMALRQGQHRPAREDRHERRPAVCWLAVSADAQIHPDVDEVPSQSRKTDKIASSDVEQARVNWITFHTMIYVLLAASSYAQQVMENSDAHKLPSGNCVNCEQRYYDKHVHVMALRC
jgi:hypothetical protein